MAAPGVAEASASPVVLVTGASRGIGAATAQSLAAAGCSVMLTARTEQALRAQAEDLQRAGGTAQWLAADIAAPESAQRLIDHTVQTFGRIDALVGNAGVLHVGTLADASDEEIRRSFEINLFAPMRLARAAIPRMAAQRRGRLVFVASTFAYVSAPRYTLYSASKAGLVGLAKSLALELAGSGIQVNAVAPGQVRTDMIADALDRFGEQRIAQTIPAGRVGEPEEIARAVRFLVLEAPDFMTGDVMMLDGGYTCR